MSRPALLTMAASAVLAAAPADLQRRFDQSVRPFLARHCLGCHGAANPAAQFDLRAYTTVESIARDHRRWALVAEKLHAREMPPKPMPQPTEAARRRVIDWVRDMRDAEARRNAGDPGPVLARRLSNAEYNYTIRDLTGVDIRPTREFPVDPANPAGFDNSGESLTMSPALLSKYLQAAREVANHMVLKPDGIGFAPHPMLVETDREKYTIRNIVDFYERQPTDFADYFQAAWRHKHRAALGLAGATLADAAAAGKVSPKYLPIVWDILEGAPEQAGPVAAIQSMWRALPPPPGDPRAQCVAMRDFVVRVRKLTARQFASPMVKGLSATSQPLMNWKLRAFASHRRDFDRAALRVAGEPPPQPPVVPAQNTRTGEDVTARKAAALAFKLRDGAPELEVPEGRRAEYEASFARFSNAFPDAFYIRERGRFYPDDSEDKGRLLSAGFHNVMGYFRDDQPLRELILNDSQTAELERLWREFEYIADFTTRTYVQYFFNQSGEVRGMGRESGTHRPSDKEVTAEAVIFSLRDTYIEKAKSDPANHPLAVPSIEEHFRRVNATLREVERMRADAEPRHIDALLAFASRAYRRPLSGGERDELLTFYRSLRDKSGLTHEDAVRDSIVGILMSPDFCYRIDSAADSPKSARVRPLAAPALASRLSYFLWSSLPDSALMAADLRRPEAVAAQARRMLGDGRVRGLATEFAGNWLDFRRFEGHNAVDRDRFPAFTPELRQAMFEEPIRFLEDVIRNNRPVLDLLYGDHTFVNPVLAKHYGIEGVSGTPTDWVRIDDARRYGRGGLLPMGVFLTQNSPGLRTSPVKRGYWVARRVLGEEIPPPPPTVPELPKDEAKADLPVRELLAKHRDNPACAGCHARFDSFGVALEGYGPVGESRRNDLAGRPVDVRAAFPGGGTGDGVAGLRATIRERREKDFIDNLCRKLLAYALGRSLQLSDEPVVDSMRAKLAASQYRFDTLVETIVTSPQFMNKRGD
jgi:mono/diheme cytochrome c family protein